MEAHTLIWLGIFIVLIGFLLVFAGIVLEAVKSGGEVEGGGVVIIGPIPIVFGTSSRMTVLAAVLGIVLMVLALIMYLLGRSGG